jgi:hypothetical protein
LANNQLSGSVLGTFEPSGATQANPMHGAACVCVCVCVGCESQSKRRYYRGGGAAPTADRRLSLHCCAARRAASPCVCVCVCVCARVRARVWARAHARARVWAIACVCVCAWSCAGRGRSRHRSLISLHKAQRLCPEHGKRQISMMRLEVWCWNSQKSEWIEVDAEVSEGWPGGSSRARRGHPRAPPLSGAAKPSPHAARTVPTQPPPQSTPPPQPPAPRSAPWGSSRRGRARCSAWRRATCGYGTTSSTASERAAAKGRRRQRKGSWRGKTAGAARPRGAAAGLDGRARRGRAAAGKRPPAG